MPAMGAATGAGCAGVAFANTGRPASGAVPATASVSVPLPPTALLSSNSRVMAGTSPARSVLGTATKSTTWSPTAGRRGGCKVGEEGQSEGVGVNGGRGAGCVRGTPSAFPPPQQRRGECGATVPGAPS